MHEMALCEGIVQLLEEQAKIQHYARVNAVWLEIGRLAGVEREALRFGFDVVTRGTLAESAVLELIDLPGQAYCFNCETTVTIEQRYEACPNCGGYQLQVTSGDQLRVKELEVE